MRREKLVRRTLMVLWLLFMFAALVRNLPSSVALRRLVEPIDTFILSKLAFYHRGWGMFPGPTFRSSEMRLRYDWNNSPSTYVTYFPYRASILKSTWNEVMEDMGVRIDNGDMNHKYLQGFFRYQCTNYRSEEGEAPKSMGIEMGSVPVHELMTNYGNLYSPIIFSQKFIYDCSTHEFTILRK